MGNRDNSLAYGLLLGLAAELLAYRWLALELRPASAGPEFVLAVSVMGLLGLRAVVVVILYASAWRYRDRLQVDPAVPRLDLVLMVLREYFALLAYFVVLMPTDPWRRSEPGPAGGTPVILVHGFLCNGSFWWWLRRRLRSRGHGPVYPVNLPPMYWHMDTSVVRLDQAVAAICSRTGSERVILVGHSMGGVLARQYACRGALRERVAAIVTLGSPHHGTKLAGLLAAGECGPPAPSVKWLTELNRSDPGGAPCTSIYSLHDDLVSPASGAHLASARNVALSALGHLEMGFSERILDLLDQALLETRSRSTSSP